jgi:hypothetical protein
MVISLLMMSFCVICLSYCNELKKDNGKDFIASKAAASPKNGVFAVYPF